MWYPEGNYYKYHYDDAKAFYKRVFFNYSPEIQEIVKHLEHWYNNYVVDDIENGAFDGFNLEMVKDYFFNMDYLGDIVTENISDIVPNIDEYYEAYVADVKDKNLIEDMTDFYAEEGYSSEEVKEEIVIFLTCILIHSNVNNMVYYGHNPITTIMLEVSPKGMAEECREIDY